MNLIIFLFLSQSVFAQTKLWQSLDNEPSTFGIKQINPQKYKVLRLDVTSIKSFLNKTPLEFTTAAKSVSSVLELPMPDGTFEEFVIVESPMMEAELAQKFPDIKTYSGYSLKNPAATARLDFTPRGFHAMVLSPEGTFFIDPYSTATVEYYISYDKKDFVSKKNFTCGVDQIKQPSIDTPNAPTPDAPTGINASIGDGVLRNYRLALAATGEYTTFHGGTVTLALAAQVTTMNRVNGVFLRDFAVKMNIIANNNLIIYTNGASDPYTNDDGEILLDENITNLNTVIGNANFDIGHVFSTGGGGIAYTPSVCSSSYKGGGVTGQGAPVGDAFDIDYVAHEMGHQFGGNHTQNNNCQRNSATAFEPGSGYTIMGYAGICSPNVQSNSDAHFHGGNLSEMHTFITGSGNSCSTKPTYTNAKPSITSNTVNQTIPKGTPFMLTAVATDANGNALTYCWDQMDTQVATQPPVGTATGGPSFRGFAPVSSGTRYFPRLSDLVANVSPTWEVLPTTARSLNFRLVVRDNATGGGANDRVDITLTVNGTAGPFVMNIPSATGISYAGLSSQTITWAVASTNVTPVSCTNVDILLSTDGGLTYPTTLASNVTNNGSAVVTIPNLSTTTARIMVKGTGRAFFDISNNNFSIVPCSVPNAPTSVSVNNTNICSGISVSLSASCATGTVTWYNASTGGTALGTGTGFSQSPTTNTTYYAACENGNCKSSRVATSQVTVTLQPTIPTSVSVNNTNVCAGNSVSLSATCATGAITWYNASTGGTALGTGTGFSQTPIANTTYYAACENGSCKSTRVATSQITIVQTTATITTDITSGTSILQAAQTITASNKIISSANVTYKAGNSISLNTGFEAQNGSVFFAQIQGCN